VNDIKIRFFGNVPLAQGDETFTIRTGEQGRFVWTDVLARRDGKWQIVAGQDAVAPATKESREAALFTAADPSVTARKEIAKTRSAILDYFQDFFQDFPANEFEPVSAEVMVTGPWAVDRGSYHWKGTPRAGGKPEADTGKYLVVLQRQSDGAWKVARDMGNSNRPLTQSTRGVR
jgi:ketosteroid isomerase-like protein